MINEQTAINQTLTVVFEHAINKNDESLSGSTPFTSRHETMPLSGATPLTAHHETMPLSGATPLTAHHKTMPLSEATPFTAHHEHMPECQATLFCSPIFHQFYNPLGISPPFNEPRLEMSASATQKLAGPLHRSLRNNPTALLAFKNAVVANKLDEVQHMLDQGININDVDSDDRWDACWHEPALKIAVRYNYLPMVQLLLERGADPNIKDRNGNTALSSATGRSADPCMIDLLARYGADVNERNNEGQTALIEAAGLGNHTCVLQLIKHGADVNATNNQGWSPILYAASNFDHMHFGVASEDIINSLRKNGADINAVTHCGWSALMYAARRNRADLFKRLLTMGADPYLVNAHGETAGDIATNPIIRCMVGEWETKKTMRLVMQRKEIPCDVARIIDGFLPFGRMGR